MSKREDEEDKEEKDLRSNNGYSLLDLRELTPFSGFFASRFAFRDLFACFVCSMVSLFKLKASLYPLKVRLFALLSPSMLPTRIDKTQPNQI